MTLDGWTAVNFVRPHWTPRRTQGFGCSLEDRGGEVAVVDVAGELRAAAAPELARTIRRAERDARLVVLDLRRLTFIDPCAAHVIVAAAVQAQQAGRRVVVVHGPVDPGFASKALAVVELAPSQPAVQALLELARDERAA